MIYLDNLLNNALKELTKHSSVVIAVGDSTGGKPNLISISRSVANIGLGSVIYILHVSFSWDFHIRIIFAFSQLLIFRANLGRQPSSQKLLVEAMHYLCIASQALYSNVLSAIDTSPLNAILVDWHVSFNIWRWWLNVVSPGINWRPKWRWPLTLIDPFPEELDRSTSLCVVYWIFSFQWQVF